MNWLQKISGIWEDIEKYGPRSKRVQEFATEWTPRRQFTSTFGYATPDKEALEEIYNFVGNDSVLEIGAGKALWAKLLQDMGITVIATDSKAGRPPGSEDPSTIHDDNVYWSKELEEEVPEQFSLEGQPFDRTTYTEVITMDANEAIETYPQCNVLLVIWPPHDSLMAYDALQRFGGSKLIYIGEGDLGCTGCKEFHQELHENWKRINHLCIPTWPSMYDCGYFYVRK